MTTHSASSKPFNSQQIHPRRVTFQFSAQAPRLWLRNSSIMTQLPNGTNLFLPAFESYMVQTIQSQLRTLHEPELRSQVSGLLGQEINHSRAHQQYNEVLRQQGYQFETYLKCVHWLFNRLIPRLNLSLQLGIIAGFEHLTASISDVILQYQLLADADSTMRSLWEWHALEELEHKSVAFDVFQAVGGTYVMRVLGGLLGIAIIISLMTTGMLLLAVQDAKFFSLRTLSDLTKLLFTEYRLVPRTFSPILSYFQPSFHPSQQGSVGYEK